MGQTGAFRRVRGSMVHYHRFAADAPVTQTITNGATKYICNICGSKSNPYG